MNAVHHAVLRYPAPAPVRAPLTPEEESRFYHEYREEESSVFTPVHVLDFLQKELEMLKGKPVDPKVRERIETMRAYYQTRGQPDKPGPDGETNINSLGAILTIDALVSYFEEEVGPDGTKNDVLQFILKWTDGMGENRGWTVPGMLDRSYAHDNPTITRQDAIAYLLNKELNVKRTDIAYTVPFPSFDDPLRDYRLKAYSHIGFVLLHKRPALVPEQHISVPLNKLEELVALRTPLARTPELPERAIMARHHHSLLRMVLQTKQFRDTMEKVRMAQSAWQQALRLNPHAERPSALPSTVENRDCPNCMEILVGAHVICDEGHIVCKACLPVLKAQSQFCPACRDRPMRVVPIRVRRLDEVIESGNPSEYAKRFRAINDGEPFRSWKDHAAFQGRFITYSA